MAQALDRNALCHCGSGKKYKSCHMKADQSKSSSSNMKLIALIAGLALGAFLVFQALTGSGNSATPNCPAGQVWSDAHNHCH